MALRRRSLSRPAAGFPSVMVLHVNPDAVRDELTFSRYCNKSATASRSLSASAGSYGSFDRPRRTNKG